MILTIYGQSVIKYVPDPPSTMAEARRDAPSAEIQLCLSGRLKDDFRVQAEAERRKFVPGSPSRLRSFMAATTARSHYGSKQGEIQTLNYTLSHERGSERSEQASERVSAAERASEASRAEQANE